MNTLKFQQQQNGVIQAEGFPLRRVMSLPSLDACDAWVRLMVI